jgi:phage tail-like protein
MAGGRGVPTGKFAFEFGGTKAGWIQSVEGGHAVADVVAEKVGADNMVHKHIAGVKYEDITVNCGTGMSKAFYEWIKASFDRQHKRNDGAIHACDYDGNIVSSLDFYHGLISEVGFPALDAASKDAAKMTIKIASEYTRHKKGSGKVDPSGYSLGKGEQKKWLPSNFRLTIAGLTCTHVNKIEALVLKQKVIDHAIGEKRDYEKEPANLETPNLVVTFSEHTADDWYKFHEDFVIKGNNGQDKEKTGTLEYLTSDLSKTLFKLDFQGLGIFKLTPDKVEAGGENIRRVKAELYCEHINFSYEGGSTWA